MEHRLLVRICAALAVLGLAIVVSACGTASSESSSESTAATESEAEAAAPSEEGEEEASSTPAAAEEGSGACGEVPYKAPQGSADLEKLPQEIREGFSGYFYPVNTTIYSKFKGQGGEPWKIGYADYFSENGWHQDALAEFEAEAKKLGEAGIVSGVTATSSNLNNSLQIQQINSMIEQGVGAIVALPNSPTAFNSVIKKAYDAGIPFITLDSYVTSPYAINVDNNGFLVGEKVAAAIAKKIGGKGNVVIIDGINGTPANTAFHAGYLAGFKNCPEINVAGTVEGQWSETATKSGMLQFLATHPEEINAVVNGGDETVGVIQALEQAGRPLVPIGDSNPDQGSLVALLEKLPNEYVASTDPPQESAANAIQTAVRVAQGQMPIQQVMVANPPIVEGKKILEEWVDPSWKISDPGATPAPPGTEWLPPKQLAKFFAQPKELP